MINLLIRDLDKEMTEAKTQEEASQKEYEGLMADSAEKRADDVRSITLKDSAKANAQELLVKEQGDAQSQTQMMMATKKYEQQLHAECDCSCRITTFGRVHVHRSVTTLRMPKQRSAGLTFLFF